ncbi:hypothetical protein Efla_001736 [Eimeria flavescens]
MSMRETAKQTAASSWVLQKMQQAKKQPHANALRETHVGIDPTHSAVLCVRLQPANKCEDAAAGSRGIKRAQWTARGRQALQSDRLMGRVSGYFFDSTRQLVVSSKPPDVKRTKTASSRPPELQSAAGRLRGRGAKETPRLHGRS